MIILFQVETIGDAYCVAGGLHKETDTHAQQIAWMALKMIETCSLHQTHQGQSIRVSRYSLIMLYFCNIVKIPSL